MKTKTLTAFIFVLSLINPAPVWAKAAASLPLQDGGELMRADISLDGVELIVSSPYIPGEFIASAPEDAIQIATAMQWEPFYQIEIITAPIEVTPEIENLRREGITVGENYESNLLEFRRQQGAEPAETGSINLFGSPVNGTTSVVPLSLRGEDARPVMISEWVGEYGERVWTVRISRLADDGLAPLIDPALFSVDSPDAALPSTSLQAQADFQPPENLREVKLAGDLPAPSWWSGECNVNNHPGSYAMGASYRGVKACGPKSTSVLVNFGVGVKQLEWQCPELTKRYLYLAYGIAPYSANGNMVVWNYNGDKLVKISNGTVGKAPMPGDVLSYGATDPYGHTSLVSASNVDSSGNGTITIVEQNWATTGTRTHTVSNWTVQSSMAISGWLHDPSSDASPCLSYSYKGAALFKQAQCREDAGAAIQVNTPGSSNMTALSFDNQARSIYLAAGWSARVWDLVNKKGFTRCFTQTVPDLALEKYDYGSEIVKNGKATISSIEIFNDTTCGGAIANDDFGSAVSIASVPFTATQSNLNALTASDDPVLSCVKRKGARTVWYRYETDVTKNITVFTGGSNYNTVLGVWSGTRGSLTQLACNNDFNGARQSKTAFTAQPGTVYYIEIAGYDAKSYGDLTLRILNTAEVNLLGPADETVIASQPALVKWESYPGATRYVLQTSLDGVKFKAAVKTTKLQGSLKNLLSGNTYYWRVVAYRSSKVVAKSAIRRLSVP